MAPLPDTTSGSGPGSEGAPRRRRWGLGLSSRLLLLTVAFVMLAEVLIFIPSVANFRNAWLQDRLAGARTAALVLEAAPAEAIPEPIVQELLASIGAEGLALRIRGTRRLLARQEEVPLPAARYDLREMLSFEAVTHAFTALLVPSDRRIAVIGPAAAGGDFVEIMLPEAPLSQALRGFALNILALSLIISFIAAALMFVTLRALIVRPVERLTASVMRFEARPEDGTAVLRPSGRSDEIGRAEAALAAMQGTVQQQMRQREHLAAMGLAVSKINHDLRNMLASAQLISDRLVHSTDPLVQRFAPKLIQALDRAIRFCEGSLAFGRAEERPPRLASVPLAPLLEEVRAVIAFPEDGSIGWTVEMPEGFTVVADAEHLFRVVMNLCRNAVQAMAAMPAPPGGHRLTLRAEAGPDHDAITIADTGPGIPPGRRERLFAAFQSAGKLGGTGLGLAIASDLMRLQGGSITLDETAAGARFRLILPRRG